MSFNAYRYNNGRAPENFPRLPPGNYGHIDPPDLSLPDTGFQTTSEAFRRSSEAARREHQERLRREHQEEMIRRQQESTSFGIKQVTPDDYDEDDDVIPMGPVQSAQSQQRVVIVKYIEKKKKKKHKKRSSTPDSDDSSNRKEKKKKRHHQSDERSGVSDDELEISPSKRARNEPEISSPFDASKNPWKLLKKGEYKYGPAHLVIDRKSEKDNLQYEEPYTHEVPPYYSIIIPGKLRMISEIYDKQINDKVQLSFGKNDRMFGINGMKNLNGLKIERNFRKKNNERNEDFLQLSHQPLVDGDEEFSNVKEELTDERLNTMNLTDYMHFEKSKEVSYEESLSNRNIVNQYSILYNKVNQSPNDVKSWLDFIDIQRAHFAQNECGDPDAPIHNKAAYYQRVMEVLRRAIKANPGDADLQIRLMKIMEGQYGANYEEVRNHWNKLQNQFINNIKMWENCIKMRMNDRKTFKLEDTINLIDKAINKLVFLKNGLTVSHTYMEGSDEFLVKLLVTRCRLLIAAGFLDRAVGMLQALAEYHFFKPKNLQNTNVRQGYIENRKIEMANYRKFWESLVPRIGVATADGWNSFNEEENTQREWIDGEIDDLNGAKLEKQSVEDEEFASYRRNTLTLLEARRRLEKFRSRYYWEPVKYKHDDVKLYEYSSRIVRFGDVKPILFPLEQSLACDLIYKLLHIFGVTIPGLDLCSQEDILRAFSSKLFPSFRPNSLQLDKFSAFIGNFIQQLANSDNIDDPARLYTAIVMNISNSGIKDSEKIAKLKDLVRHTNKMKRHGTDQTINLECQFSILTFAFEELMKLAPKDRYPIEIAFKLLCINLDNKNTSIWEFTTNANEDDSRRSMNRRQRLGYLRFILMIARTLPFSDDEEADMQANAIKIKGNTEREFCLRTKREFLLNIWATGKLEQVPITNQYIEIARKKVQQMLKNGAPRNVDDLKHRWFGNEYEIIFELAAYFLYEYSFAGYHKYTLFQNLRPLFTSELAKSLTNSQVLVEIRVQMLQHITRVCKGLHFTPANLINLIGEQIKQFPHSIPLLKALLDVNNRFKQKFFLWNYPGQDNLTKLIRNCGRLYAERIRLDTDIKVRGNNEKELKTMITRMVSLYRKTAEESSDNLIPDDYFWVILIRMMIDSRFILSFAPIQEVFILGQEVCPWSKTFLFEAARERPAADNFHVILNSSTNTHGLSKYCTDEETKLILANEIA